MKSNSLRSHPSSTPTDKHVLPILTVVVPCYNEAPSLQIFYQALSKIADQLAQKVQFEFLFVNDGSRDDTLISLAGLAKIDRRVKYISFSRNFGKEAALFAGLEHASGDYVVPMDADLQDPPAKLPEMLTTLQEDGYDAVGLRRVNRKGEPLIRSFFARGFYKLINKISKTEMVDGARDYFLMTRPVVDAIISLREYNRYTKGIYCFVGFRTKWLEYENVERVAGETKWSFWSLFSYAIEGIVSFSTMPLVVSAVLGVILCFIAIIAAVLIVIRTLIFGDPVAGWPTLACLILLTGGAQLLCLGIVGEYLSKTYLEVKRRPIYIIDQKNSHGIDHIDTHI